MDFLNHIEFIEISKQLYKHNFTTDIDGMFIEINLWKTKWLLFGTYHPPSGSDKEYFERRELALDAYSDYDKYLLVGAFNAEESEPCFNNSFYHCDSKYLAMEKTCCKIIDNPIPKIYYFHPGPDKRC